MQREDNVKIQEDAHLQAEEKLIQEILPSMISEGISPAHTFILDF